MEEIAVQTGDLPPGTQVGEYQVQGKLGEGGMGMVFAGVQPLIGKRVAIKVLAPELARNADVVRRFITEARAVNQIGHRNIIDIFSFGQLPDGRHYFVMEYLEGESLSERLSRLKVMRFPEGIPILLQVCDALAAAHAKGIVHRDLKPDNVYLAAGDPPFVKLLDFGIAKLSGPEGALSKTRTGVPIGTPYYMAPEQCRGTAVDYRTDIYALGVMMYEMFTGRVPFEGETFVEVMAAHMSQPPTPPSQFSEVPPELERIILKCLQKRPEDRYQSVTEIAEELRGVQSLLPNEAPALRSVAQGAIGAMAEAAQTGYATPQGLTGALPPLGAQQSQSAGLSQSSPSLVMSQSSPSLPVAQPKRSLPLPALIVGFVVAAAAVAVAVVGVLGPKVKGGGAQGGVAQGVGHGGGPQPGIPARGEAKKARVVVTASESGAEVEVDGVKKGVVPLTLELTQGEPHVVIVSKEGFRPHTERFTLRPEEQERTIKAALSRLELPKGTLTVVTGRPQAIVFVDGKEVGRGERVTTTVIADAAHLVRAEAEGRKPQERTVTLRAGESKTETFTLQRVGGAKPLTAPGKATTEGKKADAPKTPTNIDETLKPW